jgi:hypothetical protein
MACSGQCNDCVRGRAFHKRSRADARDAARSIEPLAHCEAAIEQQHGLVCQLHDIKRAMAAQPVLLRQHGQDIQGKERLLPETFIGHHERQVNIAAFEAVCQTKAAVLHKVYLDARMTAPVMG